MSDAIESVASDFEGKAVAINTQHMNVWAAGLAALLGLVLGVSATFGIFGGASWPGSTFALGQHPLVHDDLPDLYQEFRCPCCENNIGECTCPLAADRRELIREFVTLGASRNDVYDFVFLHDGPTVFFDQSLATDARGRVESSLPSERPEMSVGEDAVDLGAVSMANGPVSTRFVVSNNGRTDLTITGLATSCMCTTAALETADGLGPTFGAHPDENPVGWSALLAPGEEATLIVTFDPNAHGPDAVGLFRRVITLTSNDPLQPAVEVEIAGEVVP